jgi:DNA-binding MarR family transcriptional regulator
MLSSQVLSQQASAALDAWARLLRGHATITRALNAQLVAEHGLTLKDYEALLHLFRAEDNRLRGVDLAERLALTASGVTRLLDGLEREGLVERRVCDSDRRVTYAVLTPTGSDRLDAASDSHLAAIRTVFEERFNEEEIGQLALLLERLPEAARATGEDCAA